MPSIAAHMVMAKLISDMLEIDSDEFIKGNLYPDIVNDENSHHKIKGEIFMVPDLNYFQNNLDLNNPFYLGWYTHFLLDKHFLDEYIPEKVKDLTIFETRVIYDEYDYINGKLLETFSVDVDSYSRILKTLCSYPDINEQKLLKNIKFLNNKRSVETNYLKLDDFAVFLDEVAYMICEEIEEAKKGHKMSLHIME